MVQRINPTPQNMEQVRRNFQILSKIMADLGIDQEQVSVIWGNIGGNIQLQSDLNSRLSGLGNDIAKVASDLLKHTSDEKIHFEDIFGGGNADTNYTLTCHLGGASL